jgi:DNA-binding XRE family transcriptional regulator
MDDIIQRIGLNISKRRIELKLTQTELAYRCGFEKQNMYRIEKGKTNPTIKTLLIISKELNIDITEIIK